MTSKYIAHLALSEAAARLRLNFLQTSDNEDAWRLTFTDGSVFDVEYDHAVHRIIIQGEVGEVADSARMRIYEILLQYNYLWSYTGGIRMALDGMPGQVVVMFELPAADLEVSRVSSALSNLVEIKRAWREILQSTDGLESPAFPQALEPLAEATP